MWNHVFIQHLTYISIIYKEILNGFLYSFWGEKTWSNCRCRVQFENTEPESEYRHVQRRSFMFDCERRAMIIRPKHKVSRLGTYNSLVCTCGFCGAQIDIFGKDCLGFAEPTQRVFRRNKQYAVVYRCPKCFELQWCHTSIDGYLCFQRWERRHVQGKRRRRSSRII